MTLAELDLQEKRHNYVFPESTVSVTSSRTELAITYGNQCKIWDLRTKRYFLQLYVVKKPNFMHLFIE